MRPENEKKMKTTAKAQPSASEIGGDIIERYCEHQAQMIEHLRKLPPDLDPAKTIVTSPLAGFVTYASTIAIRSSQCTGRGILIRRSGFMETAGFPKSI
jgi:hypothetical protein